MTNYIRIGDSPFVPDLVAVATKNNEDCGLLLLSVDGGGLSELDLTFAGKWGTTSKLLDALTHLELWSYFPRDLKP